MRSLTLTICLAIVINTSFAQYYLRGELKDEQGNGLQGARIALASKGNYPFYTGRSGAFGIPSGLKIDTITFTFEGYDTLKTAVVTSQYGIFELKSPRKKELTTLHLSSYNKSLLEQSDPLTTDEGETYSSTIENAIVNTKDFPETSLGLHVNRASYSNIRRFINTKERPPSDAIRIEDMLNYFNIKIDNPKDQQKTFLYNSKLTSCPWNSKKQLLFINLLAKKINLDKTPPTNFVFLIDVSGSMDMPNRLPLLKSAFKLLTENLRSQDVVSIVTYGDVVTELLPKITGDHKQQIIEAIEGLRPVGSTPGASAIRTAYRIAKENFITDGNNRIILATDGDFNVGQNSEKDLEDLVTQETKAGIYLTCFGVGMGNYKDSKLEALAKKGNGNFSYIDNESEAEKMLVEEFAQTLYAVANNVFLEVKFNTDVVKEYRLIGFDNKKSVLATKTNQLEGGEIGSGNSILATFEITTIDSIKPDINTKKSKSLATVLLTYNTPASSEIIKELYDATQNYIPLTEADSCLRFATSVIMFGSMLKQSPFAKEYSWEQIAKLASSASNQKNLLEMEFVDLINKAKKIYSTKRK